MANCAGRFLLIAVTLSLSSISVTEGSVSLNRTRRSEPGKCLMSGVCQSGDEKVHGYVPCAIESDHHKFDGDEEMYQVLKEECAELFSGIERPEVCCTAEELKAIQASINVMTQYFTDCPSCSANFREIYCHFSCAPNQDDFIEILQKSPSPDPAIEMVAELNYYVDRTFIESLWNSCKSSIIAMQFTQMGSGCKDECNVNDFLMAMGQKSPTTPFAIHLIMGDKSSKYTPAKLTPRNCNDGCDSKCGAVS